MTSDPVPVWPRIEAVTRPDGTGELTIDGTRHPIKAPTAQEAHQAVLARITATAAELQRPVRALVGGPKGPWPLIVHPDGRVESDDSRPAWAIGPVPSSPPAAPPTTALPTAPPATAPPTPVPPAQAPAPAPPTTSGPVSAAPEPLVTGAPQPVVEKSGSDPWASAARLSQEGVVPAAPPESFPPASLIQPNYDLPEEDTVVRLPGEVVDTTPPPAQPEAPRRRRIVPLTIAIAGAVVLLAAGAVAVVALTGDPEPGPTASAGAQPGEGAILPVRAPAGYGQTALWSVPVGKDPQVLLAPEEGVLTAPVGEDRIRVLGQAKGTVTWEGLEPVENLHISRVGKGPVLVADSPGTLHVWPLDITDPAGVAPTTIDLGSDQAEVTYDGTAPLIVLPDQAVALLDGETPVRREIPAGATPVAATPQQVIAVSPSAWWTITADADPVQHSLPRPEQAVGDPTAAIAVGGNQLAVVWRTADSAQDVVALVGLNRNAIRATSLIRSAVVPADAEPLRDSSGPTRTIGPVLLDVGARPLIADLGDITPEAVVGRTVYGTSKDKPAVATWTPEGVDLKVTESPGETAPIAALTKDVAFMVASEGDETLLYALPRIDGASSTKKAPTARPSSAAPSAAPTAQG